MTYSEHRDKAGRDFRERTGLKRFAPESIDSLVAIMRDARRPLCDAETAWGHWRAWANSSESAVNTWDGGETLDQTDCAIDVALLRKGKTVEEIEAMSPAERKKARAAGSPERLLINKQRISEAFAELETRGTVIFKGRQIIFPVSPKTNNPSKSRGPRTFEDDPEFLEWWKVQAPADFEAWLTARTAYYDSRKPGRTAYRQWQSRRTSGGGDLIDVKIPNESNGRQAAPAAESACLPAPLAELRAFLPEAYLSDEALTGLDGWFAAELGIDYEPAGYVAFVAQRVRHGHAGSGLVLGRASLPADYCSKVRQEAPARRAEAESAARRRMEAEAQSESELISMHKAAIADPFSTPDELEMARSHPATAGYVPPAAATAHAFDRRVLDDLATLDRPCDPGVRAKCEARLLKAAGLDGERLEELKRQHKSAKK